RTGGIGIDATRHRPGQHLARGSYRSHRKRLVDPGPDERHLVQEAETAFPLQKTNSSFDFLFKHLQGEQRHGGMRLYTLRTMGTVVGYYLADQRSVRLRAPSALPGVVAEEVLALGEEAGGFGLSVLRRQLLELGQQLALALGEV